jgi:hypothetical protein
MFKNILSQQLLFFQFQFVLHITIHVCISPHSQTQNILECMSETNANQVRENIVELILVTDLSKQAGFFKEWMERRIEPVSEWVVVV